MGPRPYEFASREHLIDQLRSNRDQLAAWFETRMDLDYLIKSGVGSNTFRVFHHMPVSPSLVFRSWASMRLQNGGFTNEISNIASQEEYDTWIKDFRQDLGAYWEQQMGPEHRMRYAPSTKLSDVLMKYVILWREFPDHQRTRLIEFLHVPLDSYSLLALRNCVPQSEHQTVIGMIPRNAKMGFVDSEAKYNALQLLARKLAEEAGVPAIYLDVLAWDMVH